MARTSVGTKLYVGVMAVFLLLSGSFVVFQHNREKSYRVELLNTRLQDYNTRMAEVLAAGHDTTAESIGRYVATHAMPDIRVTMIRPDGTVFFDSQRKDCSRLENHRNRDEVRQALKYGAGHDFDRKSTTTGTSYFYSATNFPGQHFIIRSALPYNDSLARMLHTDHHYLWFSLAALLLLTALLYRFAHRLGMNVMKLRAFASRADRNESLDTEDLVGFPDDELGEIAEKIIKIYKRLQRTKQEQSILKRQLTQNIAHELKTPVASIQGYLETIIDNPSISDDMKQQFLQRCYAQAQRLTSLLRDISTLNRLDDAPDMTADFSEVDITRLVDGIQKETALQMEGNGMTFVNRLPGGVAVRGNQSLVYSVFRNLTDNAIAYSGAGTTVTVEAVEEQDRWRFTFSDNGVGVPYEHLPRLFERFYRVDKGRSRKMGGTGLGLAIVKNAVLLHGGTITVKNAEDGGLVFSFSLRK